MEALDIYLDKYGVTDCSDLPKECIIQSTDSVNSDKDVQYNYECNELIDDNIYDSVQSNVETASEIDNYIDQFSTNIDPVDFGYWARFTASHPQYNTQHVRMCAEKDAKVPDFI